MEIILTPQEQANLATEAAKRGVSAQALLDLAARRAWRGTKSNGWCARRGEFLDRQGKAVQEDLPKLAGRRRSNTRGVHD